MPRQPRTQNTSSAHPGVWPITRNRRGGLTVYLARWYEKHHDEAGNVKSRRREESLSAHGLTTEQARLEWMINKSKELGAYETVYGGAGPQTFRKLADEYLDNRKGELGAKTLGQYARALDAFVKWASGIGIPRCDQLKPGHLQKLRAYLTSARKRKPVKKGKAGEFEEGTQQLSAVAINQRMKDVKAFLVEMLVGRHVVGILEADLTRTLRPLKEPKHNINAMHPQQIRQLVEATRRHDAEQMDDEPRYHGFADFVHLLLLGGMRLGEARQLKWEHVNIDGQQIVIPPEHVKTKAGRTVDLAISPSVLTMLERRKLTARPGAVYVFSGRPEEGKPEEPLTETLCKSTRKRLIADYGSGRFGWHQLRKTASSYLSSSDVYSGDAALKAAARHGHHIQVAYARYAKVFNNLPPSGGTLEKVMGVDELFPTSRSKTAPPIRHPAS